MFSRVVCASAGGSGVAGGDGGGGASELLPLLVVVLAASIIPPPCGFVGAVCSGFSSFFGSRRLCRFASCVPWSMTQKVNAPNSSNIPVRGVAQPGGRAADS